MATVWPAHACGTLRTLTWVTLPLLSTLRVAVSDDDVQPLTATLPAPSFPEVRPRVAAEATPTETSAAVSAMPKILVSRFTAHHLPTGSRRGAEMTPRSLSAGTETPGYETTTEMPVTALASTFPDVEMFAVVPDAGSVPVISAPTVAPAAPVSWILYALFRQAAGMLVRFTW